MRLLIKVAKDLNVGMNSISEFLLTKGYEIENKPTGRVSDEMYNLLLTEFTQSLIEKDVTDQIKDDLLPWDIDNSRQNNIHNTIPKFSDIGKIDVNSKTISKNNPKIFISYSWDNAEHKKWVEKLARVLMSNGILTILDQYELSLGDSLQHFMEKSIPDVDKVIIIMTPKYKAKAEERKGGVGYEYSIISEELFSSQNTNKFIPILREGEPQESVPIFLKSRLYLDMRSKINIYNDLKQIIFTIYSKREIEKPEIGPKPDFNELNFDGFED
ncbi:MAG: toll/interleukin-1 receptor domain-containing protein [Saprospiraceae bacterium]|nr:toll/interleukin-1 receptor domain-containing protein [Saprospiraceae bacterium]